MEDIFFDLFGEEGCLAPSSGDSAIMPDGSPDSGHGSSFRASPDSFSWETNDNDVDFWGSIIDEIPNDITDVDSDSSEQLSYSSVSPANILSYAEDDNPGTWTTELIDEGLLNRDREMELKSDSDVDCAMNLISPIADTNDKTPEAFVVKSPSIVENKLIPDQTVQLSPIVTQATAPVLKSPSWVANSSDIKLKIGQNIFTILQSDNKASNKSSHIFSFQKANLPVVIADKDDENPRSNVMCYTDHDYADTEERMNVSTTGVSKGMGPGLVLTHEEKRLLELENLSIPEDAPLTKEEEKCLKKVRRKIKNKQSAMESRRKRKEYIENLERRVKHCTDVNQGLRKKVDKLTKDNKILVNQLKSMKEFIAASFQQSKTSQTGTTCLAVLLLSFALFVLPFNPLFFGGKADNNSPTETVNPTAVFRSRTLLSVDDNTEYNYHDNELNGTFYLSNNYESIMNDLIIYDDNKINQHFGKVGDFENEYIQNTNISMYIHQNFTLNSAIEDIYTDLRWTRFKIVA